MEGCDDTGQPPTVQAPDEVWPGHCRRQAGRRRASEDVGQHPSASRVAPVTESRDRADRYLILIEGGPPSNYSAWSPDLPGCVAAGRSIEEAEQEMRRAIAFHLAGLAEDGAEIPDPSGPGVYVERTTLTAA